jgi:hypothetical protein
VSYRGREADTVSSTASEPEFSLEACAAAIKSVLMAGYKLRDPSSKLPIFAFRVHQFLSRGDTVYASLESEPVRNLTVNPQQFVPNTDKAKLLFPLEFCRECGLIRQRKGCATQADYTEVARRTARQLPDYAGQIVRTLLSIVQKPDTDLVVEVGANDGTFLDLLREAWRLLPGVYDLAVGELSVGAARSHALQNADVVFLMGARLNWIMHFGLPPRFNKNVRIVQLDIAAEQIGQNAPTEVALVGDGKAIVGQLNKALGGRKWVYPKGTPWHTANCTVFFRL